MIPAFALQTYNYRAELEMSDKTWANVFSPFMRRVSKLQDLTERIQLTSSSSLAHVIEFRWCAFIQRKRKKNPLQEETHIVTDQYNAVVILVFHAIRDILEYSKFWISLEVGVWQIYCRYIWLLPAINHNNSTTFIHYLYIYFCVISVFPLQSTNNNSPRTTWSDR